MNRICAFLLAASTLTSPCLAQTAITLGERPITRTEVSRFVKKQFGVMDGNHDGHVSPAEFESYRAQQVGKEQAGIGHIGARWFEKADADGDGRVTLPEAEARPLRFFDMADANGDGTASVDEQSVAKLFMGK